MLHKVQTSSWAQRAPGKRRQQVMPAMTAEMRWFRSPNEGFVSFNVRKQMSYRASLSATRQHMLMRVHDGQWPDEA